MFLGLDIGTSGVKAVIIDDAGKVVTGELDFCIGGSLKWAIELLVNGTKIGGRVQHFDPTVGKYQKVEMNDWLVVDCRPYNGKGAKDRNRCTLLFSEDLKECVCQMGVEKHEILGLES